MVELKINGEVVDVTDEVVISYNYDLYGEVLSNFTTSYTNAIDLPMTSTNKMVFGYPNITYGDIGQYVFELYKDGVLYDTGSVLVDHVTDDVISINLFSQLITKGEELSNIQSFAECCKDRTGRIRIPYYNSETGEWGWTTKLLSTGDISMNVSSIVDDPDHVLYYEDSNNATTEGYLYLATANIGKPKALNCDSYYDATASPKIAQWPEGGERTFLQTLTLDGVPAIQTRFYDLQPIMPVDVFLLNLFRGKDITISQGVHNLLNGGITGDPANPKSYITLPSLREFIEDQTYDPIEVLPTSSTTASTVFNGVYPVNGELKIRGLFDTDPVLWGQTVNCTAAQLVTIQVRHVSDTPVTKKYMVYSDGDSKKVKKSPSMTVRDWYRNSSVTKLQRKDLENYYFVVDGLGDVDYDVVITCTGVAFSAYDFRSNSGQVIYQQVDRFSWDNSWIPLSGVCSTSGQKSTFKILDYFSIIREPWKLAVDICKQFNLRFKYTSPNTMELCLGCAFNRFGGLDCEYYDIPTVDTDGVVIDEYLDWSNFSIKPQVFENKTVTFTPEFNDTQWDAYVAKNYVYPYGTMIEGTNYPIKSEEEWFDWNALKHLSTFGTWKFVLPPIPGHSTLSGDRTLLAMSQAFDKDDNQVSIAYSLCTLAPYIYSKNGYICNEMQSSDFCYYGQDYLIDHLVEDGEAVHITYMPHLSTLRGISIEQYLFGQRVTPTEVVVDFTGFGDVLDQMQSSKLVLNVFLDKMLVDINDFIRKVYYIDGSNYIVGAVHSYAIGSGNPCEVEFIKVQDLDNYRIEGTPTYYTVTFSCQHGSVGATVDGVGIQSGSSVEEGKTVVFTITPDEGYEYLGTNPESVVVSGNVTKSYECTELPVYHTVTFSCTNGSVGATVDGVGIQSGTQVLEGKTVVFTITPDSGYEYEGTNPENVVVDADVSKSYECTPIGEWAGLKFTANNATAKMGWKTNNALLEKTIQYSIDGGNTWISLVSSTEPTLVEFSEIRIKGDNSTYSDLVQAYWCSFTFEGSVSASGNIMSIIQSSGYKTLTSFTDIRVFRFLFWNCTTLTTAPELPATTLTENCYQCMFMGCTSLVSSPSVLPATTTTQQCYIAMFSGCTSLVSAPEIKGVILGQYCYNSMFYNCSSLHGTVIIRATSPYSSETTTACGTMFSGSGTAEGAGGIIKVGGSTADWNSTNAGIDSSIWEVELLNENE